MLFTRKTLALLGLSLLAGCGGGSATPATIYSLDGSWSERFVKVTPGSGTNLTLQTKGSVVTGSGMYLIEAGAPIAFQVTGTLNRNQFNLTLTQSAGAAQTLQGSIIDANHLQGGNETFTRTN